MSQKIKKVLVVEDDLSQQPVWTEIFRRCSPTIRLDWAVSCEVAQKMVHDSNEKRTYFDLIVVDLFLAGSGTGMDLINSSEVQSSHASTMLVSSVETKKIRDFYGGPILATQIISKPFSIKECEKTICKILDISAIERGGGLDG